MPFANLTDARYAGGIINEGLSRLGYANSTQIDVGDDATVDTIEAGMRAIGTLPADLVNPLLNQIDIVLIYRNYATMFTESKNPTRAFWRDAIRFGGGIEDVYQEILQPLDPVLGTWAQDYANGDPDKKLALANAAYHFGYHDGEVTKKFHTKKNHKDFAISLAEHEISKIFTPEGFMGYVSVRIANLQYSAEIYLQNVVIENMRKMVSENALVFIEHQNINNMLGITQYVEDLKTATMGMKQPTTAYNKAGILTMSDDEDLYLVTTPEYYARVATRGAENAYNLQEYMNKNRVIMLPAGTSFGTSPSGETVYSMLIDKRAIVLAIRYWSMKNFIPTGSDFQNYFLKVEHIEGYNEFFNAVAFAGEAFENFTSDSVGGNAGGIVAITGEFGTEVGVQIVSIDVSGENVITHEPDFYNNTGFYRSYENATKITIVVRDELSGIYIVKANGVTYMKTIASIGDDTTISVDIPSGYAIEIVRENP